MLLAVILLILSAVVLVDTIPNRILGGTNAVIEDVPYQASLQYFNYFYCGGVIIGEVWILTAAHCIINSFTFFYTVRIGSSYRGTGGTTHPVQNIIVHELFGYPIIGSNDIALIRLRYSMRFSRSVHPIVMADDDDYLEEGTPCLISGFGSLKWGGPMAYQLQKAVVLKVSAKRCHKIFSYRFDPSSMFCAGHEKGGIDACKGDSGGPLVAKNKLFGLVSWGDNCGLPGIPGVYTKIASLRLWIRTYTGDTMLDRIIGGVGATIKEVPYLASLHFNGWHHCGAVIISRSWVLSAAHCLQEVVHRYAVRVGSSYRNYGGSLYRVEKIIFHENYGIVVTYDHDIGVAKLHTPISFTVVAQPIRLPEQDEEVKDGTMFTISGWGAQVVYSKGTVKVHKAYVPKISRKKCQEMYMSSTITSVMICAGYAKGGIDACSGDSGGPLVAHNTVYGLVSWGYGCGWAGYPGVYTRIASVRHWIRNITGI